MNLDTNKKYVHTINQYIERLENISFDVDKLNEAVSELIKIRPFENSEQKPGMLKSNAICLNYDEKDWMNGLVVILG